MTKQQFDYKSRHVVIQTHPRSGGKRWSWSYSIDGAATLSNRDANLISEDAAIEQARQTAEHEIDTGRPPFGS